MKKKYFLFGLALLMLTAAKAQNGSISGRVLNTTNNSPLKNAIVLVIGKTDSVIHHFVRTDRRGEYQILHIQRGNYYLQCHYPGFLDFNDTFSIDSAEKKQMDSILLLNKSFAINEIIINKFTDGLRMNGDTVEYLADFFKTNPGATVEDLLKRLPGITINKNGEITAQGEKVKKILVDGEEFFPDDPSVATKYLRADMVDKVQVYDQREDTTSKNDNDKVKTLNLTLKADKKKGYFGKAETASNFDKYTNAGTFTGYFNKKLKAAGYIKNSNFEDAALNWEDSKSFGGTASGGMNYEENYGYYYRDESFNDNLDNRGIPYNTSAGLTFNNTWDSGKAKLNTSYRFANEGINGKILTNSLYFLPDTSYGIHDTTEQRSNQDGHRAYFSFMRKTDSFNTLTFTSSAGASKGKTNNILQSGTSSAQKINHTKRELDNAYEKLQFSSKIDWGKKFRKKGKYFNLSANFSYNPSNSSQNLKSSNTFFAESGIIKNKTTLNQLKISDVKTMQTGISSRFGNKIDKYSSWNVHYNFNYQNNSNQILSYNNENGSNASPIDSLSNIFSFNQMQNTGGVGYNYNRRKWSFWINASAGISNYFLNNKSKLIVTNRQFINLIPSAGGSFTWKKQGSVSVYYNGYNSAPPASSLQPIINNSDPFNLFVGNSALGQSFNHSLNVYLHDYQTIKGRYFSCQFGADLPRNAFVTSTWVDSNAIRRTMTVNANGNYSVDGSVSYQLRTKKIPLSFSWELSGVNRKSITFVNNQKIETLQSSATAEMSVGMYTETVSFSIAYSLNYNWSVNSLNKNKITSYVIQTPNYFIDINLPGNFVIYHSGNFNIRPVSKEFTNNRNVYYLVAGIGKYFGKQRDFELSFLMNDLLNQNKGFTRNISTNLVSEQIYTQLSRYWLVGLKWNFASKGVKKDE